MTIKLRHTRTLIEHVVRLKNSCTKPLLLTELTRKKNQVRKLVAYTSHFNRQSGINSCGSSIYTAGSSNVTLQTRFRDSVNTSSLFYIYETETYEKYIVQSFTLASLTGLLMPNRLLWQL